MNKLENIWKFIQETIKYGEILSDEYRSERIRMSEEKGWRCPKFDENTANSGGKLKFSRFVFYFGYCRDKNNCLLLNYYFRGRLKDDFSFNLMFDKHDDNLKLIRFYETRSTFYTKNELYVDFQTNDYLEWFHDKICQAFNIDAQNKFNKLMSVFDEAMLGLI